MWLPLAGLLIGILLGLSSDIHIPPAWSHYLAVAVLAALDTVFGGMRANLEGTFDVRVFASGFFSNTLLAAGLAFLGERLGIDLYLAAIFVFGVRLFNNLAMIRRILLNRLSDWRPHEKDRKKIV
ncbi:MAG: small basic protein [Bacillus thermozeamaize]|jgi:small basic protein|uniref:Small basic protein n=1 Tax=Bacillus thermozeamaize TaxID=230954 RepID=A0A1Y3PK68_9BACI|nr:MAG: small basic protein [Bacillus thermozeamaize]